MNKLATFTTEVKAEMKKVSWSTRKELVNSAWIVIFSVVLLAAYIGLVDFIIAKAVHIIIR